MRYYLKAFFIYAYFIIFLVLANLIALLRPFHPNNTHKILKVFKPAFFFADLKVTNLTPDFHYDKPAVYIFNHQDLLDIFMFSQHWPRNTVVIGKRSLLFLPLFGTAFWLAGNLFINRSNKKQAWGLMDQVADAIQNGRKSVAFMPEGTRSRGKGLLPFKQGAFAVAIKAGVDVIPVCASASKLVDLNEKSTQQAYISFLPPISTKNLAETDAEALAKKSHELMKAAIEDMSNL